MAESSLYADASVLLLLPTPPSAWSCVEFVCVQCHSTGAESVELGRWAAESSSMWMQARSWLGLMAKVLGLALEEVKLSAAVAHEAPHSSP